MARSRRGGSSSGGGLFGSRKKEAPKPALRAAPKPAPAATTQQPPAPMQSHPPAQQSGGMLSGIGSTIAQGMAFGTGSAIAHRAVGAVANSFGGSDDGAPAEMQQQQPAVAAQQIDQQQQMLQGACAQDKQMFFDCLKVNRGDQEACSFLYEQLQTCQRQETTFN
mmetsp:Transcript_3337/g.7072  ORF Transcript_3337/g.7072 Transcript_3337/m.7072 type:complete len:165 (-) Transcript_3337:315-809(-)